MRAERKEPPNPTGKQGDPARVAVEQRGQAGMGQVHLAAPEIILRFADPGRREGNL